MFRVTYYQEFTDINEAIEAEKKIKGWLRIKKDNLIAAFNPS